LGRQASRFIVGLQRFVVAAVSFGLLSALNEFFRALRIWTRDRVGSRRRELWLLRGSRGTQ
jgi:hypothetical protein